VYVADDADPREVEIARVAQRVAGVPDEPSVRGARVRALGSVSDRQLADWYAAGVEVDRTPPVADPALELRHWVREQAVSHTRHRHGRLLD
jgi:RHH-type proline utilization regulon transcriptional repressor/proline dehydrogenase/delta 1-pyrroline-5-carboxylate dehydrogenase